LKELVKEICLTYQEASKYGVKVAVLDFIKPTPSGTTWGKYETNYQQEASKCNFRSYGMN
jgi:hypothetical protein